MVLSGYLFAKLINGRPVKYHLFLWNRALRLLPLMVVAMTFGFLLQAGDDKAQYLNDVVRGFILPTMPRGGWSIIVEAHFYLLLPMLLWSAHRKRAAPFVVVAIALTLRLMLAASGADVQTLSYYTLVGRIDQFALGIAIFYVPVPRRVAGMMMVGLWLFYMWFDASGGFYFNTNPYVWAILPTIEGMGFAALVSCYDRHPLQSRLMRPVEQAGKYSFSIYLLQFSLVAPVANFVDRHIMELSSLYIALPWALLFFAYMAALSRLTYTHIEMPFLRLRKPYLLTTKGSTGQAALVAGTVSTEPEMHSGRRLKRSRASTNLSGAGYAD